MTTLLKDDVVLITGGGSGLGAGVARHCLAEGAKLAIMDISGAKLDSLRSELGDEPLLFQGDATCVTTGTIVAADQGLMNRNVLTPVKAGTSK
ncbi:SDR family NAD(P)-dependent oxidoreductase [Paraburkholderia sp. CNPSo 3272]|uniref:SDR family NAD(P)-dependent oxidoreductase n=1 Tax=Paraburkholderia sp. CNPSo 3272 TaxID=2940931 RepID=UPI0020B6B6B8|nr:SDR family NAD(P)-dependent oxidoreductase [Paraburkholderia sp. CNPSo 3272]MCP3725902.1 SDR family NAD(P)-dependent oxidoreductase [Paraburkholderia sp. CNPSo 3272]